MTEARANSLLKQVWWVSWIDLALLVPLVVGVIVDYHGLAPILGPIHGAGFLWEMVLVCRGAAEGYWGWWYPAVTLFTGGPPGALIFHGRAKREALSRVEAVTA